MKTLLLIDAFTDSRAIAVRSIHAASKLGHAVGVFIFGTHAHAVAEAVASLPVQAIHTHTMDGQHVPIAEQVTALVLEHFAGYRHYVMAVSSSGKDILPRLAMKLDVQPITDVVEIISDTEFKRPTYAGNVVVTVTCSQPITCLTIRHTCFAAALAGDAQASITALDAPLLPSAMQYEPLAEKDAGAPDLASARVVVSAGNGIGTAEKFATVEQLAAKLGAAVGASRAMVDSGVVANECQIGQTGKVIAPTLYLALGISGAVQHTAGIKDSGTIISVNKDADAPIRAISDYMLVADLDEVMPALLAAF